MDRTKSIGGSDIGAIAGLNPWKGPMDVYLEKLSLVPPQEETEALYWGKAMEPALKKRYEKETGNTVSEGVPIIHPFPNYPFLTGTPDGLINHGEGIAEWKTSGWRDPEKWGEAGSDLIPPEYLAQVQWYMGLTGAEWADLAVLFMGRRREFIIYHIPRDQELIDSLISIAVDFWKNHIIPQIPPPLDATEATRTLLKLKYPKDIGDMLPAPESALEWLSRLQTAKETIREAEIEKTLAENYLKDIIGEAQGLLADGFKVTWKRNKDSEVVDWQGIVMSLSQELRDELIKDHTTIKPGARVFRVWEQKK